MKNSLIVILVLLFSFGIILQQTSAVSSVGKTAIRWGEIKSKALAKSEKSNDPALVMSSNEFIAAINKYLAETQNDGSKLAPIKIGSYVFEIYLDSPGHPLTPCVVGQNVKHLNIHILKNGSVIYNAHIGAYIDKGSGKATLVFFGQNTANKTEICKKLSFPSVKDLKNAFNAVKNFVEDALRSVNANLGYILPAVVIVAAAYVIAVVLFSVLFPLLV